MNEVSLKAQGNVNLRPYSFLDGTIKVLLIDDSEEIHREVIKFFSDYPLFHVTCAHNARAAESMLRSDERYHVCLYDFGVTDIQNDEFYLLKKYSSKVAFVIISGTITVKKGFDARAFGARYLLEKPLQYDRDSFLPCVGKSFLYALINPAQHHNQVPILPVLTDVLVNKNPESVAELAEQMGITTAYIRKIFSDYFTVPPRLMIFLVGLYKKALDHQFKYQRQNMARVTLSDEHKKAEGYFAENRAEIVKVLAGR